MNVKPYKRTIMKRIFLTIAIAIGVSLNAQQTPARKQTEAISIEGATAHLGHGEVLENSLIMFAEGKLAFVGSANARLARMGTVIDAKGKHV